MYTPPGTGELGADLIHVTNGSAHLLIAGFLRSSFVSASPDS